MVTVADTAFSIAAVRAAEAARPAAERLFEDPYASLFAAGGAHAAEATQRYLALPFFHDGVRLRTRFLDDAVRAAIAAGLERLVLLGAGFDTRGLRMPEIRAGGVAVFEVDFPAQLERKRALLAAGGVSLPAHVAHVACDFAAPDFDLDLEASLAEAGFRRGAGAIFVWEGVVGYIDAAMIDRSLALMARVGGPGTRVAFTFASASFAPYTALERVRRAGFTTCEDCSGEDLWRRWLAGEPHPAACMMRVGLATV
ncbi:MAG: SAM-dependent methyltransferase [Polyangiaceae bacterium]|nr:SAM-dependent methyltransferase [Polyangiaceae bacterium]